MRRAVWQKATPKDRLNTDLEMRSRWTVKRNEVGPQWQNVFSRLRRLYKIVYLWNTASDFLKLSCKFLYSFSVSFLCLLNIDLHVIDYRPVWLLVILKFNENGALALLMMLHYLCFSILYPSFRAVKWIVYVSGATSAPIFRLKIYCVGSNIRG
jgi:hypothetical protein